MCDATLIIITLTPPETLLLPLKRRLKILLEKPWQRGCSLAVISNRPAPPPEAAAAAALYNSAASPQSPHL